MIQWAGILDKVCVVILCCHSLLSFLTKYLNDRSEMWLVGRILTNPSVWYKRHKQVRGTFGLVSDNVLLHSIYKLTSAK